ncbi:MAG TPA: alpha/beta fold hydrolase [Opitutaceae bacterium]
MDARTEPTLLFHVVRNDAGRTSIWPDYRREALPAGWKFEGFSGAQDACLRHIGQAPAPSAPGPAQSARSTPPAPAATSRPPVRATALPFPQPAAPQRLFVFPHAGSGASYYHFLARELKDIPLEVHILQYPGREMRVREKPVSDMDIMVSALGDELRNLLEEKPFHLLGHSMGALLAFELARHLRAAGRALPRHLFLSGRQPPHLPPQNIQVEALDDRAFLDAVGRRYKALPAELLAHSEILELILPSLRADFTLMERHRHREAPPLDIPFTLLNGVEDPWVDARRVGEWQQHTRLPLRQRTFPGGHFYLPAVAADLRREIVTAIAA